jgi:hypothetical protein
MAAPSLAISLVTWRPDLAQLEATLRSLAVAVAHAHEQATLGATRLWLIDNTEGDESLVRIRECCARALAGRGVTLELRHGQGNVGYGRGHNIALAADQSDYRLILNPDVEMEADALSAALGFLRQHPQVGLVAPAVRDDSGAPQYLCKRYPSVFDLLLRGFAPAWLKRRFAARLARYEMSDTIVDDVVEGIAIASGAFMLVRGDLVRSTGGFDPRFFLYFEDFDWSLRLGRLALNAYVPSVRVVHHGGGAARKGWSHIAMFVAGAVRFFHKHGWKLA